MLVLDMGIGLSASGIFITAMSGVGDEEAGLVSGLTATSHEIGIALVLPVLSTIAASRIGSGTLDAAAGLDPGLITTGFGDAFRAAAAVSVGAALLAVVALRRDDAAPAAQPALAH
jgi:hypothetical protein